MGKNVLIISPTPTHPVTSGNRARIFRICEILKKNGHPVSFFFLGREPADLRAMKQYFGEQHFYNYCDHPLTSFRVFVARKTRVLFNILYYHFNKALRIKVTDRTYNKKLDDYYEKGIDRYIQKHLVGKNFTHVMTEYVVFSRALLNFNEAVKIIDTHDIFTDRYRLYLDNNMPPDYYSLFKDQEAKGLNRADVVISIQEEEKKFFMGLTHKKVVVVGHFEEPAKTDSPNDSTLLFVGSRNQINLLSLQHFLEHIFPRIKQGHKQVKLLVAGSISRYANEVEKDEKVVFLGPYRDKEELYAKADVVVVPITFGTGLKIKTIEALACGKPVVTYRAGITGLPDPTPGMPYCLLAENDEDYVNLTLELLSDINLRYNTGMKALEFINGYNGANEKTLLENVFS